MTMTAVLIAGALAGIVCPASADDFQAGRPLSAASIFARCPTEHGDLATALCLGRQVAQLRRLLQTRLARRAAEIDRAARPTGPGMIDAAKAAAWKRDFVAAQAAWERYDARECGNVFTYEYAGGSAAGNFKQACQIRHLVVRINELAGP